MICQRAVLPGVQRPPPSAGGTGVPPYSSLFLLPFLDRKGLGGWSIRWPMQRMTTQDRRFPHPEYPRTTPKEHIDESEQKF
jgi:hypothetical protein